MPTKFQFIHTSDELSRETKRAHRKLARSHVASLRHYERRQQDVRTFSARVQQSERSMSSSNALVDQEAHLVAGVLQENRESTINLVVPPVPSFADVLFAPPFHALACRSSIVNNDLQPEDQCGHLICIPGQPPPLQRVGRNSGDPFSHFVQLPGGIPSRMATHLFYYVNILLPKMYPSYTTNLTGRTRGCASLALVDELGLCAVAAYAATSRAMEAKVEGFHDNAADWLYFKGRTMTLITEKLKNEDDAIAETVIGGITSLILLESFTGNVREAKAHLDGLIRIGNLRQKKLGVPLPYSLCFKILMSVIKLSSITQTRPIMPFQLSFPNQLLIPSIGHLLPGLGYALITKWSLISPNDYFLPLLHDMVQMTRLTEAAFDGIHSYAEDDSYSEYTSHENMWIEYRLLAHVAEGNMAEEACRLACLLYVNTCLVRAFPNESATIVNTLRPLKNTLESVLDTPVWAGFEDVLAWVSFVGAWCSSAPTDLSFFTKEFRKAVDALGLTCLEDARVVLSGFLFVDRVYLDRLGDIWTLDHSYS